MNTLIEFIPTVLWMAVFWWIWRQWYLKNKECAYFKESFINMINQYNRLITEAKMMVAEEQDRQKKARSWLSTIIKKGDIIQ